LSAIEFEKIVYLGAAIALKKHPQGKAADVYYDAQLEIKIRISSAVGAGYASKRDGKEIFACRDGYSFYEVW